MHSFSGCGVQRVKHDTWWCIVPSQAKITRILHGGVKLAFTRMLGGSVSSVGGGGVDSAYASFTQEQISSRVSLGHFGSVLRTLFKTVYLTCIRDSVIVG